jgi:hypothetical protein
MAKTYTERLQLVRDAIDEILLTGQAVTYESRSWTAANLDQLRALETEYEKRATQENPTAAVRNRIIYVEPQ